MAGALCMALSAGCRKHDNPTPAPPVPVDVVVTGSGDMYSASGARAYSGTVGSSDEAMVSFSVPGTITAIYVKDGQKVTKGTVLAKVRSETLDNERDIAVAELEQVTDLHRRLKKLHDQNALPEVEWVNIQTRLRQARSAVAVAERAVSDATLTSPITGYVAEKIADVGQGVIPAQPVMKIIGLDNLQVTVPVPGEEINGFGPQVSADVRFDSLDGLSVTGKFASKDVNADPLTRSYTVRFDIPDAGGRILPGMIATVKTSVSEKPDTAASSSSFVVPSQAVLLSADNRHFVWIVRNGMAERRYVTADELSQGGVAVTEGLVRGDSLIVAGMQKVSTGTRVVTQSR